MAQESESGRSAFLVKFSSIVIMTLKSGSLLNSKKYLRIVASDRGGRSLASSALAELNSSKSSSLSTAYCSSFGLMKQ